jgi:leucyl aminopeptidase
VLGLIAAPRRTGARSRAHRCRGDHLGARPRQHVAEATSGRCTRGHSWSQAWTARRHGARARRQALVAGGYGGIVGVGGGSSIKPRLVELRWQPEGATRHVALVGKGITFDTGGYSLKPTAGMETMKMDMAGAATAAAVVRAAAELELPVAVTAVLALAENMVSGDAQRVSDVVTMRNGTTVEVMNTDAEGRLVLGDGIAHAAELGADSDRRRRDAHRRRRRRARRSDRRGDGQRRCARRRAASRSAGERRAAVALPLAVDEYGKRVEGTVADLRNVGTARPGTIFGALFLQRFVPTGTAGRTSTSPASPGATP